MLQIDCAEYDEIAIATSSLIDTTNIRANDENT